MSIEIEPIGGATSGTNWTRSGNTYNNTGQFSSILIPILPLTSGKIYFEYEFTSGGPFGFFINIQRPPTRSGNYHDGAAGNGNGGESALRWAPSAPGSTRYRAVIDIDNATLETIGYSGVQTLAGTGDIYLGVYDCTSSNIGSGTLYFKESEFINPIPSGATAWYEALNPVAAARFTKNGNDVTSANEGDTVTVHISSTATATGTVNYTLSGISSADINDASLTGSVSLTNYEASFDIVITNDVSTGEGEETLTVSFVLDGTNYSYDLVINDSSAIPIVASGGEYNYISSSGHALHVFKTNGTFTVTESGTVEYLIIGGGGGGGADMGGGGGAGGYLAGSTTLTAGTYNIVIGAGGSGAPAGTGQVRGSNGANTVAIGLTAIGGGGGASNHSSNGSPAGNGGSGGGGSGARLDNANYGGLNGTGTTGQGNDGARSGNAWYPGGGGGAGAAAVQTGSLVAHGGIGIENNILGTSYYWAAGGGGGGYSTYGGDGGLGGGGGGAPRGTSGFGGGSALNSGSDAEVGTLSSQTNKRGGSAGANTGSGGGGGSHYSATNDGGDGGSGIVIFKYTAPPPIIGFYKTDSDLRIVLNSLGGEIPGASQPNGTVVPYTISGNYITEDKIGNPLTGNFVLTNNTDEITISLLTIPDTTLTFTAFGETVTYDIIYPTALEGDVTEVPITFNLGYYKTLPVQQLLNGIPISMSDYEWVSNGAVDNYKTGIIIPEELLNSIPISMSDYEWISNGVINNYKFNTPITGDFSTIEPYRVTTVSSGGRMNVFTVNPLGAEIINETWY